MLSELQSEPLQHRVLLLAARKKWQGARLV